MNIIYLNQLKNFDSVKKLTFGDYTKFNMKNVRILKESSILRDYFVDKLSDSKYPLFLGWLNYVGEFIISLKADKVLFN